jgi:hypothetical protein
MLVQLLSVRIFSVLVNSMPDERTNSTITWLNSPVRGNQQSRSIINMIQVGQWYGKHVKDEPKVRTSTHNGNCSSNNKLITCFVFQKSCSRARPAVKFRVIDKGVLERLQTQSEEECRLRRELEEAGSAAQIPEDVTEEGDGSDSDDDGENTAVTQAESSGTTGDSMPLPVVFKVNPHIDLKLAALRDMISEEPIVQAHATVQISEKVPASCTTVTVEQAFAEW